MESCPKNLGTASFDLNNKGSLDISPSKNARAVTSGTELITVRSSSSVSVYAYLDQRLLVLINLRYHAFVICASILIVPCWTILLVVESIFAKNLSNKVLLPSPITTDQILGSITRYLICLSFILKASVQISHSDHHLQNSHRSPSEIIFF